MESDVHDVTVVEPRRRTPSGLVRRRGARCAEPAHRAVVWLAIEPDRGDRNLPYEFYGDPQLPERDSSQP